MQMMIYDVRSLQSLWRSSLDNLKNIYMVKKRKTNIKETV